MRGERPTACRPGVTTVCTSFAAGFCQHARSSAPPPLVHQLRHGNQLLHNLRHMNHRFLESVAEHWCCWYALPAAATSARRGRASPSGAGSGNTPGPAPPRSGATSSSEVSSQYSKLAPALSVFCLRGASFGTDPALFCAEWRWAACRAALTVRAGLLSHSRKNQFLCVLGVRGIFWLHGVVRDCKCALFMVLMWRFPTVLGDERVLQDLLRFSLLG